MRLPSTLTSLGGFKGWSYGRGIHLTDVYCAGVVPFTDCNFGETGATLHVPAMALGAYMFEPSWNCFKNVVADDNELTVLSVLSGQRFKLVSNEGLADGADVNVWGDLKINVSDPLHLGKLCTSFGANIIPQTPVAADNVGVNLYFNENQWNFFTLPFDVKLADMRAPDNSLWAVREYSGTDRAALTGDTWHNVASTDTLHAGRGYALHCTGGRVFTFPSFTQAVALAHEDVVTPLDEYPSEFAHNASWNLVGNPFMSRLPIKWIDHNGIITVWDGYWGGYYAYSPIDDDYDLQPYQAFFVQRGQDESMTFLAEGRYMAGDEVPVRPAPLRIAGQNERQVMNFNLCAAGRQCDRARLVFNPKATMGYDMWCDASKFAGQGAAELYFVEQGARQAIDERPADTGRAVMGMTVRAEGDYEISLATAVAGVEVTLTDTATGAVTRLDRGAYAFRAEAGYNEGRFIVEVSAPAVGISSLGADWQQQPVVAYTIDGRCLGTVEASTLPAGIYVLRQGAKAVKVAVK